MPAVPALSAALVKALRERTGIGFMQCKEALQEAGGDIEKAVDVLRQKGLKSADRKADRATSQGRIGARVQEGRGVLVELDCESDFVARNEGFVTLVDELCRFLMAASQAPASVEALLACKLDPKTTVEDRLKAAIAKIGENIRLHRFVRLDGGHGKQTASYVHPPGRIAVLIEADGPPAPELLRDLCMHVAAVNPLAVSPTDIPETVLEREKAVYMVQVHGKPPAVAEKMMKGKVEAFFAERCLLRQPFVKDGAVTVEAHIQRTAPGLVLRRFVRYEIGV